jgi:oxygen-independent coproporphyrinogen III oxidase
LRKDYLGTSEVKTLYFGGGTPSWLSMDELTDIVTTLEMNFALNCVAERTIEANPEDITRDKLKGWRALGFNRLSIGIQSFNDEVLKRINRTHTAQDALRSVEWAADSGFENIGIDLILGLPGYTRLHLQHDLEIVNHLPITHLSVYLLSIDSNTVFEKLMQKGRFQPQTDDELADQYLWVSDYLKSIGFEHYEISNFAKNSKYSLHNTSYWQQQKYVGFGPAAHSFDLISTSLSQSPDCNNSLIDNFFVLISFNLHMNRLTFSSASSRHGFAKITNSDKNKVLLLKTLFNTFKENLLIKRRINH